MRLFHFSDIQIRPLGRHDEFKSLFKKLYKSLIDNNACDNNSIIVVCGDIVQEKDKLKPETIMIMREFFKNLSLITNCVVLIAGNHDLLENNKERLDNITPIITDLDNIHYLKNTGEYLINGVNFVVNSIIDNKFIKNINGKNKNKNKKIFNVGLYHGMLNGCVLDNGMVMNGRSVSVNDFKEYDYVLLGDIHKHQYMNKKKTIAYSGSLVQQNFGEPYKGHGYIIWDLEEENSKFIEIKSKYGFYNIFDNNSIDQIESKYGYIRYHIKDNDDNNNFEELKKLVEQKCTVLREEIRYINDENDTDFDDNFNFIEQCQNNDIEIFKQQLAKKDIQNIDKIIDYHSNIKKDIELNDNFASGGYWTIDYLEFKNMLIYGGDHINKITFNNGVISICGNNAIGKSCILKLIIFTLFDKTCSNDKNSIINKNHNTCYVKLNFSFSGNLGKKYTVIRNGKNRTNKNKKEVRFETEFTENGKNINLEHGKKTMEDLRRFLGGYEDFIMTNVFSHSYNDISLLKITDKARLDVFIRYFKLDIYKKLQDICKKDIKDVNAKLNYLFGKLDMFVDNNDDKINSQKSNDIITKIKSLKKKLSKNKIKGESIVSFDKYNQIKLLDTKKHNENIDYEQIITIKNKIMDFNVNWSKKDENNLNNLNNLYNFENEKEIEEINYNGDSQIIWDINKINDKLIKYDTNYLEFYNKNKDILDEDPLMLKMEIIDIGDEQYWTDNDEKELLSLYDKGFDDLDINKVKIWMDSKSINADIYAELEKRNNVFNKYLLDGKSGDGLKDIIQKEVDGYYDGLKELIWKSNGNINMFGNYYEKFIKWYDLMEKKKNIADNLEIHEKNREIKQKLELIGKFSEINDLLNMKKYVVYSNYTKWLEYKQRKEQYLLIKEVDDLEKKWRYTLIKDYEMSIDGVNIQKEIEILEKELDDLSKMAKIKLEIDELKNKLELLGVYKEIVDKNGIPKDILCDNIGNIVKMINRFLRDFVGFTLDINIDNDKFEMFVAKGGIKLGIGDLSGYESFILNVAFKYALLRLSMINKCGCLFVDEGLDCIDLGNFDRLGEVFKGLGRVFGKIIVITHIEDIKRFENWNIRIKRDGKGNSMIYI